ncbi:DUF559 domain-containing protein [Microlunatus sp. Y2014]|uniref:endonuclease domain-containing protein n=1 Tax=Microlunatus sp. Y2014 TaxID=3418488 RepID=UPI003DA79FB2
MESTPRVPFGVARTAALAEFGVSRAELRRLSATGQLRSVRRGWWATPDADPAVVRAVSLGGSVTCLSALERHGLWVPETRDLHLRFSEHLYSSRLGLAPGVRVCMPRCHWRASRSSVDQLPLALAAAGDCTSAEEFVAILDSATHRLGLFPSELGELLREAPAKARRLLHLCDRAESGTESLARLRLRALRLPVRVQVPIAGVGRVDLLVGRRLVIEIDSRAHHTGTENHSRDRTRDRRLVALGYLPVRLTYHQVVHDWEAVLPDLLAIVRRGEHLLTPRPTRGKAPGRARS